MSRRLFLGVTAALVLLTGSSFSPAEGADYQPVVSTNPVDWTPHIRDGAVYAMTIVGDAVVVGGDFSEVSSADRGTDYERWNIMAFSLSTGRVLPMRAELDGPVWALAPGPDNSVLVGGDFNKVDGVTNPGLARLDVGTGRPSAGFDGWVDGDVRAIVVRGGWAYVGGWFGFADDVSRKALARIDVRTGALDRSFDAKLQAPEIGRAKVEGLAISPAGDRLAVIGALTQVLGQKRVQVALLDISRPGVRLAGWSTDAYNPRCRRQFDTYMRDVDFSPDGDYFVIVTTGRMSAPDLLCDTAARFETYAAGSTKPTWVNHTGGDSLYAVAVTGTAVYVGGHQRWLDNPNGHEDAGFGAVSRPGIAAIDPRTGRAMAWNPTRSRGEGLRAFVVCPQGLLVGSDTDQLGHEYHGRIGMFPLR
ncbi:MAG: delta-60 repeat domain-containing protein [Hamadaea sp.]|uniref:delta-60 repeat domain-containing protein n=1 Tax=Hamadaea sp. TaxID=2024425 RepID=UPI0017EF5F4A|nr:delta-60 repeat domain-containing protein [Hamadaea sp.]NUR71894.1 delta-60 repeat domain-containing protein [Hamadaea sp.]NUT17954.1 delta-60 repeat domain-containing protein [Hamadaea sp.]